MSPATQIRGPEGLIRRCSPDGVEETLTRLEAAVARHGLRVFARLDHGAAAKSAGLWLPPTVVLIVGAARVGTPLMAEHPWLAIDLPLRILVHQPQVGGGAHVGGVDPTSLAARHDLDADDPRVSSLRATLLAILSEATRTAS